MLNKLKLCKRHNGGKGVELPVVNFPKDSKRHDHLSDWCKQCWRDYRNEKAGGKSTAKVGAKVIKKTVVKSKAPMKKVAVKAAKAKESLPEG